MKLVIWGTGGCAEDYIPTLDPAHSIVAVVDGDPAKQGTTFHGKTVQSPAELPGLDFDFLIVASTFYYEIREIITAQKLAPIEKVRGVHKDWLRASFFTRQPYPTGSLSPELFERVGAVKWFHVIELAPGFVTPGCNRFNPDYMDYPQVQDLSGKRVLDIGAWDGMYTFEAERRGAEVVAYDILDPRYSGFNPTKEIFNSNARHIIGSVYDLNPQDHGVYDVVIYFGVFYHLFDPMRAFCRINEVLKPGGVLLFEGSVLDYAYNIDEKWLPYEDKMEPYTSVPLSYFTSKEFWDHWSNWFIPNQLCLKEWLESAGFRVESQGAVERISRGFGMAIKTGEPHLEHEVFPEQNPQARCR